jgi:hypothetical protein
MRFLAAPSVVVAFAVVPLAAQQRQSLAGEWQIRVEAEPDAWRAITVPRAFETVLGERFDGVARYRRTLPLPAQKVQAVRVEFAAVAMHATVFCNGTEVGQHLGGWTPFRVDVTKALRWDGNDVLEVRVDEKVGHNTQGFLPIIQPHFGGIWQDVTLCLDDGPVLDRIGASAFGTYRSIRFGQPMSELLVHAPVLGALGNTRVVAELRDGERVLDSTARTDALAVPATAAAGGAFVLASNDIAPWSPGGAKLYTLRVRLLEGEGVATRELDRLEHRVGFRELRADGTTVRWNGDAFQMRGVLHWGYSPPHLAPPIDPAWWRPQLERYNAMGFNTLKCCLWVPPRCVYELCDELGLAVWQEYPTWHPKMDQAHKQELLAEYAEFFASDRSHVSVGFRSITCETGHGADLDVVKALFEACKAAVPETLVVDDSSWIGWQRVADFWDEHPYGNNSWFPGRLGDFRDHIAKHGKKPLLLGECFAADTWVDSEAWRAAHGDAAHWWRPDCWSAQQTAEAWLRAEFGEATLRSLRPQSLDFGMRNRKFQIEQLRLGIPDAGYVVSVARDFAKARMGLDDDLGHPKWPASAWSWHGDTMLCLDHSWHERGFAADGARARIRIAHHGHETLRGELRLSSDAVPGDETRVPVEVRQGAAGGAAELALTGTVTQPTRVRVRAELTGSHAVTNHWDLWRMPPPRADAPNVREVDRLTIAVLDELEAGGTAILHAGERPGSLRTTSLWFLRGAPFAPPHPLHARVPAELLLELSSFDLETGRVMPWANLLGQVDPILAFWETHDIPEVRMHLLAGDTRVGKGRLLVTTLRLDGERNPVGAWLRAEFAAHLRNGAAPKRELAPATIAALRAQLTEKKLPLPTWRFRTDPNDEGRAANWHDPKTDVAAAPWRDVRAGSHWENQGEDLKHFTGVAWYRIDVDVPADWEGLAARVVFDGVDDSFECWLDGESLGTRGDPATSTTIWLERQVLELGPRLRSGQRHTLVLRVVDHAGAGGLWKPAFLTTGPATSGDPLLH